VSAVTPDKNSWPSVLPGFEHILRTWDARQNSCASRILPGEYYVTATDEIITTVLGSCVSACIRDPLSGVGGMNHFMLPGDTTQRMDRWGGDDCLATRYGIAAMETLINDLLKLGSRKDRLELKLFGGGNVMAMDVNGVGDRNVKFVRQFVRTEGITVVSEDLGEVFPRKVNYFPKTGKVMVRRLRSLQNQAVIDQEKNYERTVGKKQVSGEIELFD